MRMTLEWVLSRDLAFAFVHLKERTRLLLQAILLSFQATLLEPKKGRTSQLIPSQRHAWWSTGRQIEQVNVQRSAHTGIAFTPSFWRLGNVRSNWAAMPGVRSGEIRVVQDLICKSKLRALIPLSIIYIRNMDDIHGLELPTHIMMRLPWRACPVSSWYFVDTLNQTFQKRVRHVLMLSKPISFRAKRDSHVRWLDLENICW